MIIQFEVIPAIKCSKKDVISAIDIYCKSVDTNSKTDTNEIKDYIWNTKEHDKESRSMYFYILYDSNRNVLGFSEFAYLPKSKTLVLDYLCISERNPVLFYNFYYMTVQEIEETLKKKGQFIDYIITELSIAQRDKKLIDVDSNYFRHFLSNLDFKLLKYPYYQPPLSPDKKEEEFNLAIRSMSRNRNEFFIMEKEKYLSIVKELYYEHYLTWFHNVSGFKGIIDQLLLRIENEIVQNKGSEPIDMIQCKLFDDGHCPKFTVENYTYPRVKNKQLRHILILCIWLLLCIFTSAIILIPCCSRAVEILCSFFTIFAGIMTCFSYFKSS
mgnify:CR=1 FL=1